ncbi:MAG TPA: hypothetical protein VIR26_09055 [Metalysinibacillus sp.]
MTTINLLQAYELLALQEELSNEEILQQVKDQQTGEWATLISEWPMEELAKLATDEVAFTHALAGDYKISYITMPGLLNLLAKRFGLQSGTDFSVTDSTITALQLTEEQQAQVSQMLSSNWQLIKGDKGFTITM